jgi:hypothetical protein
MECGLIALIQGGYVGVTADQHAREPKSHFTLATQPGKESGVSDVKASRNIGHSEGHSYRGQRRLCTRRHAPGHPDLDLAQPYPVGREADWSSGAARPGCESAEPRSKPLTSLW